MVKKNKGIEIWIYCYIPLLQLRTRIKLSIFCLKRIECEMNNDGSGSRMKNNNGTVVAR